MDRNKKKLFWLVLAGLFCIVFLTLLTISFYGYVLEKIGVEYAENSRTCLLYTSPRPLNFLACNAPIKQLYNLGVEIEENSELDLFEAFNRHAGDPRIPDVIKDMEAELGTGNKKPEILEKLAQYELTLLDWIDGHRGRCV